MTGLFSTPAPSRRGFPAFAVSIALHGIGFAVLMYGLLYMPVIRQDPLDSRYKVRHLDLHVPETAASRAAEALYPKKDSTRQTQKAADIKPADDGAAQLTAENKLRPSPALAIKLPQGGQGKQTLIQPQVRTHVALAEETPVPSAMIWTAEEKPVVRIVPPAPEKPANANVQTSIEVPNEELELADLPVTAATRPSQMLAPPAGNTTPLTAEGAEDVQKPPATFSNSSSQPTPAAVLSVSDLRMNDGTAVLPPANETPGQDSHDGAAAGQAAGALGTGNGAAGGNRSQGNTARNSSGTGMAAPEQSATGESAEHIQLPRDGKFGVVVVGTSLAEQYPEILTIWSDRVAYTAYLHVGTPKAWILQYAQLRSADAVSGGTVDRLEAPWPYDILRPNLISKDLNADALIVHGVLTEAGRLEKLAIAYPQGYIHGSFVLSQLRQWQFRPAKQQEKPTAVEVLLIIPEDGD